MTPERLAPPTGIDSQIELGLSPKAAIAEPMSVPASIPVRLSAAMPHPVMLPTPGIAVQPPPVIPIVEGLAPVIIAGANGSGKSRFAARMAGSHGYVFVPADRETTLPDLTNQMMGPSMADDELINQTRHGQRPRKSTNITRLSYC